MSGSIIVCGGRYYADHAKVAEVLGLHVGPGCVIVHGGATGADQLAGQWADANEISSRVYRARWGKHGRAAGPIRNQYMLDHERPALVIAFPGGDGTADMVRRAKAAGVPVVEGGE